MVGQSEANTSSISLDQAASGVILSVNNQPLRLASYYGWIHGWRNEVRLKQPPA